jgi:hypothetical protein
VKAVKQDAVGALWTPQRPRFQRSSRRPVRVDDVRVVGTERPDSKRLCCGFTDAQGDHTCSAPDLGTVKSGDGITLALGMQLTGTVWGVRPSSRPLQGPYDLGGRPKPIPPGDLPILVRCRDGHLSRITVAVLTAMHTRMTMQT